MTTAAISIIVTLAGLLILLLGLGGGKMWSEKKVNNKVDAALARFTALCDGYRVPCQKERIKVEQKLANSLQALTTAIKDFQTETQQMLLVGTFTMDLISKKLDIPDADLERIKTNVKNGTYEKI